jgi:hypothetical protein
MGLDVYLTKGLSQDGFTGVSWAEALEWGDFPFQPTTELRPEYSEEGQYIGDVESDPFIAELNGPMWVYPGIRLSFRGGWYSDLLEAIGMPYSFYSSLSTEQVAELTERLGQWLRETTGPDGEPVMGKIPWQGHPTDPAKNESWQRAEFLSLQHLHTLLGWMIQHQLGTYAG